jgi:hypothetical protein
MRFSFCLLVICFCYTLTNTQNLFAQESKPGFTNLFDGKSLQGWEGNAEYWRAQDGILIGEIPANKPLKNNTFLVWKGGPVKDFELILQCRISASGNSGINYRSEYVAGLSYALKGYQADIDGQNSYTGQNYEERGRTTLAYRGQQTTISGPASASESVSSLISNNAWTKVRIDKTLGSSDALKEKIKQEDWNEIRLVIQGNRLKHYVNDILMSDVTDQDPFNSKDTGLIGLQVHVGPPMKVEYRNIQLRIIQ